MSSEEGQDAMNRWSLLGVCESWWWCRFGDRSNGIGAQHLEEGSLDSAGRGGKEES